MPARPLRGGRSNKKSRIYSSATIGVIFALFLTVFIEALLNRLDHTSFYALLRSGSYAPVGVLLAGALEGIIYEYIGSVALGQWYYPLIRHKRYYLLLLPLFWMLFMVIMQDTFAIFREIGLSKLLSFLLTAVIPFVLIEGINVYAKCWIYQRLLKIIPVLIIGWLILAYTFVVAFNAHVVNPFGF